MSRSSEEARPGARDTHLRELRLRLAPSGYAALGVEDLMAALEEPDAVRFRSLACRGCAGTVMVEVDEPIDVDRVDSLGYVDAVDLVGAGPDRLEYLLRLELPSCRAALEENDGEFFVDGPVEVGDDGLAFTAVATQAALDGLDAPCGVIEDFDDHLEVRSVREYTGRRRTEDVLTDRQREVLENAVALDYFDVPRGATADDLAAEVGLEKSTVLEHLRRAERNILGRLVDGSL